MRFMLENFRYNRALYANAKERPAHDRNIGNFLEQEFLTQESLRKLGVLSTTPVKEMTEVEKLFVKNDLLRKSPFLIVELIGMINCGKTNSIERVRKSFPFSEIFIFEDEAKKHEKIMGRKTKVKNPIMFEIINKAAIETNFYNDLSIYQGSIPREILFLIERGLWDKTVMDHHNYCVGGLHSGLFEGQNRSQHYEQLSEMPTCVINCLIRPEISLQRELNYGQRPVLLDRNILFDQYMRFHYEAVSGQLPIPLYTALDLETDLEHATEKIISAIKLFREKYLAAKKLSGRQLGLFNI